MPHLIKEIPVDRAARRKRNRADSPQREIVSKDGKRVSVLHPTKGWRDRSISRVAFGAVPNAPVHSRKIKFNLIKIEGTKNQFYQQNISTNKYAGHRRTP